MDTSEDKENSDDKPQASKEDDSSSSPKKPPSGDVTAEPDWADLLDEKQTNKLLYSLQIVEALGQPSKKRRTKSVVRDTVNSFWIYK